MPENNDKNTMSKKRAQVHRYDPDFLAMQDYTILDLNNECSLLL